MLKETTIQFLHDLKLHNNREWMHSNDKSFRAAQADFEQFTAEMIQEIRSFDASIGTPVPKDCIFRIYRDVRFSKDKSPYKPNFGAYIVLGGRKSVMAGYYIHIEPGQSMLAGGLYMPPPELLFRARQEVFYHFNEFMDIINHPSFVTYFGSLSGEKTKLAPKGFDKDFSGIEMLKFKSYVVMHSISDDLLCSEKLKEHAKKVFSAQMPFNNFFNRALS